MSSQYHTPSSDEQQRALEKSQAIATQLEAFLSPLLSCLDAYLDKRLVRTLVQTVAAMVIFRHQEQGLNLSE